MPALTPEFAGNTLIVFAVFYVVTIAYSIYMAYLNHKQSKVKDMLQETNDLLRINNQLLSEVRDRFEQMFER